ncbi:MAG: DUF3859 domain-containing protein [Planctomycetes bacterium]|nr:DUF3859 domain-containing protein [Planctomycetota bacterium]
MNTQRTACLALLLTAVCSTCVAAVAEPTGKITDYGILKIVTTKTTVQKLDSPAGERHEVKGVEVAKQTTEIPATLGTSFGILFTLTGLPADRPIALRKVVTYPEITNPNGKKQTSHSVPLEILSDNQGTISSFEGYKFTDSYELAPGEWTFEIWHGQQRLVRQVFSVVQP